MRKHAHLISRLGIEPLTMDSYIPYIHPYEKFGAMHPMFAFRPLYQIRTCFYEAYSDVVFQTIPADGGHGFFYSDMNSLPASYTDIYLFRNPITLLSYIELHAHKAEKAQNLFISFPRSSFPMALILDITSTFPSAKFHCCFEPGPQGDLLSIRVAMSTVNREFSILQQDNSYHFLDKKNQKTFGIPNQQLSLDQFRKKSGFLRIRCIRDTPPKGYTSFNHLLRSNHEYQAQ